MAESLLTNRVSEQLESERGDVAASTHDYEHRFAGPVGQYFLKIQLRKIFRALAFVTGGTILDVGGGHAQLTPQLVANGSRVTVAASDPECELLLKERLPDGGYDFVTGNLLHLPFPDQSFDAVVSIRLLAHESNWEAQIAEYCRLARRCVVIDYADRRSFNAVSGWAFRLKKRIEGNTRDYFLYNRRQIIGAFDRNGFGKHSLRPEFLLPMALHRMHGSRRLVAAVEDAFRAIRITRVFGSPVIARFDRKDGSV